MMWVVLACGQGDKKNNAVECPSVSSWTEQEQIFIDVSEQWGLTEILPTGQRILAVDYDGDNWTDLFVRTNDESDSPDNRRTWLLRNEGGYFVDRTEESGILAARGGESARAAQVAAFGDVDNDGDLDLYLGSVSAGGETAEILLNDGSGHFELASEDSEIREDLASSTSGASFVDYNLDGKLDLWLTQGGTEQDRLFWGYGDGRFVDVTRETDLQTKGWNSISDINQALAHTNSWSAAACDLNNDGYSELLSASYGRAPNHLWRAQAGDHFVNESVASGYAFDGRQDWTDNESARCWCTLHPEDEGCQGVPEPELISCQSDDDAFRWDHRYDREAFRLGGNSGTTICSDLNNDGHLSQAELERLMPWGESLLLR